MNLRVSVTVFVESNPVRAGMVERAEDYRWSSAACHFGLRDDPMLNGDLVCRGAIED
jgi:putative transposase